MKLSLKLTYKKSHFCLMPLIYFAIYMVFLIVTNRNILRVGEASAESVIIPVPFLILLLHFYLVAFCAKHKPWGAKLYGAGLLVSAWVSFMVSAWLLREAGIDLPLLMGKLFAMAVIALLSVGTYIVAGVYANKSTQKSRELEEIKQQHTAYKKKEVERKAQEVKFKERLDHVTSDFIVSVNEVITLNLDDPSLDSKAIAQKLHMTEKTFSRKLKSQLGVTPGSYLKQCRMEKAYEFYLEKKYPSQKALAAAVGFKSPSYFSRQLQIYIESEKQNQLAGSIAS